MSKSFTAPLALIKCQGATIGIMKTVQVTETAQRGSVRGIGNLTKQELPIVAYDCTFNCSAYLINLKDPIVAGAINRVAKTLDEFVDNILLEEQGIDVVIMRKVKKTVTNPQGLEEFATIRTAFPNRESFDITEQQISGRNVDFEYLEPILYQP